jgi:argininosuccinate lyase
MQEDKISLFNSVDIVLSCLDIYIRMLPRITFNTERMRQAASTGFLDATDMADYLVVQGVPFRKAHEIVGQAVAYALSQGKELSQLSIKELQRFSSSIQEDLFNFLTLAQLIARRRSAGGTAGECVRQAVEQAKAALSPRVPTENPQGSVQNEPAS